MNQPQTDELTKSSICVPGAYVLGSSCPYQHVPLPLSCTRWITEHGDEMLKCYSILSS